MALIIRPACPDDAPFLSWVMQSAGKSHLSSGLWELLLPGPEKDRLNFIEKMCISPTKTLCHFSLFHIAEKDGAPLGALSGFFPEKYTGSIFRQALTETFEMLGYTSEQIKEVFQRFIPFSHCIPTMPSDYWIVEWVAVRPEARRQGIISKLLQHIILIGIEAGAKQAQISCYIENTAAHQAYLKAGFNYVDEKTHPEFEAILGSPGILRLQQRLDQ